MTPGRAARPPHGRAARALLAVPALLLAALLASGAETSGDEIYRLGKDALTRGSFETAARLFRLLEDEPRFESDARYAFNHAQASRFASNPGEAIYWYAKYLALDPNAADAAAVKSDVAKLTFSAPQKLRAELVRRFRAAWARRREDLELARALDECPRVRLGARFRHADQPAEGTSYVYRARAVLFELSAETGEPSAVWVSADEPITAPDDAPPLLVLPPGRPMRLPLASDVGAQSTPVAPRAPAPFAPDPALAKWTIDMTAELDRSGPPLLLAGAAPGEALVEVHSGPLDATIELGRKRRELPTIATPLAFGPRLAAQDAKVYAGQRVFVIDVAAKEGTVQRWAAPPSSFSVVNTFGRLDRPSASEPPRLYVRQEPQGPYLTGM